LGKSNGTIPKAAPAHNFTVLQVVRLGHQPADLRAEGDDQHHQREYRHGHGPAALRMRQRVAFRPAWRGSFAQIGFAVDVAEVATTLGLVPNRIAHRTAVPNREHRTHLAGALDKSPVNFSTRSPT
jgi:hypothetical protein